MKRILIIFILFLMISVNAQTLKGGVSEEYVPHGFFGSWGVISKLEKTNNPSLFNRESRDIWTLSGYNNVLILENLESNARSEIVMKEKLEDSSILKFSREKIRNQKDSRTVYNETVKFKLNGKNFSGTDNFLIKTYDKNNNLIKENNALYHVEGVRISGD